jgi:hypothetical protein
LISKKPEYIIIGRIAVRKRLSYQQFTKAKITPKLLLKVALIKRATFSPMAF